MSDERKLNRAIDSALLQALHMYDDAVVDEVIYGGGFTVGRDTLVIRVNRMAWGLFEATLLKAMKEHADLVKHNPDTMSGRAECPECKGVGGFPYEGEELERQIKEWNKGMEETDYFYCKPGTKLSAFCSPCQGTGLVLKSQPEREPA